jgi:hypothetical protein
MLRRKMLKDRKRRLAWTGVFRGVWVIDGRERDLAILVPVHSPCPATFGDCLACSSLFLDLRAGGYYGAGPLPIHGVVMGYDGASIHGMAPNAGGVRL